MALATKGLSGKYEILSSNSSTNTPPYTKWKKDMAS
jgi:hypothetical protein